ncbi:hypothetical protein Bca4012_102902 [Brassica carinata]
MDGAEARDLYPAVGQEPGLDDLTTLETAQPEVGSSGWKSTARRVVYRAFPAALENPEDRVPLTPGRTHNRIRSPRAGLEDPSSEPVDCWRTARAANAARAHAACRPGTDWEQLSRDALNVKVKKFNQARVNGGVTMTLLSETTAKGTGLAESAGKEDPVELDSSPTL